MAGSCMSTAGATAPGDPECEPPSPVTLSVNVDRILSLTSSTTFACVNLDWWPRSKCDRGVCSWGEASMLHLPLDDPHLRHALRGLAPVYLRLGGSLSDFVRYDVPGAGHTGACDTNFGRPTNSSRIGYPHFSGCMSASRWDALNQLCVEAGCLLVFGINALTGRRFNGCVKPTNCRFDSRSNPCCADWSGTWDPSEAEALLRYTKWKRHRVWGFEFGNELGGSRGLAARLPAKQYTQDFCKLARIIRSLWPDESERPRLISPDSNFEGAWFAEFLERAAAAGCPPDVLTWHQYILGAGYDRQVNRRALDPTLLDKQKSAAAELARTLQASPVAGQTELWLGEGGGAYSSGRHGVTDRFCSSFWFLDGFGILSQQSHQTYCRQTLVGGSYGLLNTSTRLPNPDYYALLLWKLLMGRAVLPISPADAVLSSPLLRSYAHCSTPKAAAAGGVTVLLINLSTETSFEVGLAGFSLLGRRTDYVITSDALDSGRVALNGAWLEVHTDGTIPTLVPRVVDDASEPIIVSPVSYSFHVFEGARAHACADFFKFTGGHGWS